MNKEKWLALKEFVKETMNSDKVTLENSCHYQIILNKIYELEEVNNEKII
jgi:hypothetical protein